jgi:vacuolar-type H+-ATPase subunit H
MAQRTAEEKVNNASLLADEKVAQADRTSEERIGHATVTAENILADARIKAERMIRDAEASVLDFGHELTMLQELRNAGFASLHSYISEISGVLDKAESTGKIQIPTMTLNLMTRSGMQTSAAAQQASSQSYGHQASAPAQAQTYQTPQPAENYAAAPASAPPYVPAQNMTPEQMQAQLANTLSILGIDLSLLNTNPSPGSDKV